SSMGAGGKMDPTQLKVADISKSFNCPFAQLIRKRLRPRKIYKGITVVFSTELPDKESLLVTDGSNFKKSSYGTISYLPAAFGGAVASVAIRALIQD
ncbi:MAG: tRNA threonylcarbamoyladenosine dehydratase, partial [Bacteroidota bacterium]